MIRPVDQRVSADDLDLDRAASGVGFLEIALLVRIGRQGIDEGKDAPSVTGPGWRRLEKVLRNQDTVSLHAQASQRLRSSSGETQCCGS